MSTGLRAGTNNDGYLQVNGTDVLTALSSGRIGIGTTGPARKVEIVDTAATVLQLNSTSTDGTSLRILHSGNDKMYMGLAGDFIIGQGNNVTDSAIRSNGDLMFAAGGATERLRILSDGTIDFKDNAIVNVGSIALDFIKGDADDNTNITFAGNDTITFKAGDTSPALTINTTQVKVEDGQKFVAGTGNDLQIYHDTATGDSFISETGTGNLKLTTGSFRLRNAADSEHIIWANEDAEVRLYHDSVKRFETTSTGATVTGTLDLAAISSSISDTAVDVFVYDTSKDSDGGAWRKRTQHTSWYNETLNTSIRGSRREFPAVAVIVCTSTTVRIYDGDDPDLPMWMEFVTGGNWSHILVSTAGYIKAAEMLNGELVVARNLNTGWQLVKVSFIADTAYAYKNVAHGTGDGQWNGGIVSRNGYGGYTTISTASNIISQYNNDVAMTVLPNAPIDSATGLPIPTIAVATDGGVSVIRDDGTVVDLYRSSGNEFSHQVAFDENNSLFFSWGTTNGQERHLAYYETIPSSDDTELTDNYYPSANFGSAAFGFNGQGIIANNGRDFAGSDDKQYLTRLYHTKESATSNTSSVVNITSSYNTGWMHGNIKGAFLSDTDSTNVSGSALITGEDSNFNSGTIGNWAVGQNSGTALLTNNSNKLKLDTNSSSYPKATLNVGTQQPGLYTLAGEFYMTSAAVQIIYDTGGAVNTSTLNETVNTWHSFQRTFEMTTSFDSIGFRMNVSGGSHSAQFDNLTLSKAEPDRSVNNKGLQVFGTVTKSAVATGAELVAYSGWSNSNYLVQPYNSDLNFGTDDFSTSLWIYTTDANLTGFVFDRGGPVNNTDPRFAVYIENDAIILYTYASGASSTLSHSFDEYENQWTHVVMTRDSTGAMQIFINGTRVSSGSATARNVTSSTNPELTIGNRYSRDGINPLDATISLLRISGSIPSAEQVKKMYEDEKVLFQENAKATLYGSSDAVTALAYDDSTNLLYAGTSSGRSDFQGLRRINNTTTAVTTAMSASNGLVAEQ